MLVSLYSLVNAVIVRQIEKLGCEIFTISNSRNDLRKKFKIVDITNKRTNANEKVDIFRII